MAENTKIEWCDATWNPLAGCSIVSPGCHHCYAMRTAYRLEAMGQEKYQGTTEKKNGRILWTGKINLDESALLIPLKKKKPTTWFVNSMSDLFHESVPDELIARVFAVMALCPQHTFQLLTKRAERMVKFFDCLCLPSHWEHALNCHAAMLTHGERDLTDFRWPLQNVWLGVSVEDQQRADKRIPHLLNCPAAVRFISAEPLLGQIDLDSPEADGLHALGCGHEGCECGDRGIDWVITGGESGPGARPMHPDFVRSIRDQCVDAGVAFFFKQWGEWVEDIGQVNEAGRDPWPSQ